VTPKDVLDLKEASKYLGIDEASLKVLAAEGLVTMKVRRGAYVTEVSEQDLAEVYHLLALLESDATGRRLGLLQEVHRQVAQPADPAHLILPAA